ncbi:unnamed protein product [Euphydryas editha]|uniref:Peptidase S1 domain-containing protein n=1 Tax=Euphydryas editha TaxID=104508 RepID=A0AAU9UM40_EUPED|nr:unnamed protein product [Euphydryas editha]
MIGKYLCLVVALFCAASAAPESRIVGGTPTTIEEFPYMAAFIYHYPRPDIYIQRCVGSIISSYHVLTTAYCFTGANLENMNIRVGSTNSLEGGQMVGIRNVVQNPNYVESPRAGDIAVVFLAEPIFISNNINIVYLPPAGQNIPDGLPTEIISWGFESEQGPQLENLKTVTVTTIPLADCQASFENENVTISDDVICTNAADKGVCTGDSGAPLVYNSVLFGISSVFKDCGSDEYPDVFTRIDSYTEWIVEVTRATKTGSMQSLPRIADV